MPAIKINVQVRKMLGISVCGIIIPGGVLSPVESHPRNLLLRISLRKTGAPLTAAVVSAVENQSRLASRGGHRIGACYLWLWKLATNKVDNRPHHVNNNYRWFPSAHNLSPGGLLGEISLREKYRVATCWVILVDSFKFEHTFLLFL